MKEANINIIEREREGNSHQSNRSDLQQNIYELLYSTLPSIADTHFSLSTPSVLRPYIYFCAKKEAHAFNEK